MSGLDLLVVGDCNPDVIVRAADPTPRFGQGERLVDAIELTIGGSSAITACAAARLGLRVALVSLVGSDTWGEVILQLVAARGVDVEHVQRTSELPTGCTVALSSPRDRAMLTAAGTIDRLTAAMVDRELLREARHVHVGSYFLQRELQASLPDLLRTARAWGATLSIDPNWDPSGEWDSGIRELLPLIDVFLPNAVEARTISGRDDDEGAARALAGPVLEVAVKRGPDGALAVHADQAFAATAPRVNAVDTTGAGDSFDAGYLAARMRGWDIERRLRFATACGAFATTAVGGTAAQADEVRARALMETVEPPARA